MDDKISSRMDTTPLLDKTILITGAASGIGRETHKMMLDHDRQTKNLLVSYSPNALGFF